MVYYSHLDEYYSDEKNYEWSIDNEKNTISTHHHRT